MQEQEFPDVERVLVEDLSQFATTGEVTPENLERPFIRVQRVGGYDDGITDRPRVEISCYSPTRRQSAQLSEQVRQRVLALSGTSDAGVHIDRVETENQAGRTPFDNDDVRRIAATFRVSLRRSR